MSRIAIAVACAAAFGVGAAAQSSNQSSAQDRQQAKTQEQAARQGSHQVTLTGCVRQASDSPTVYALQQIEERDQQAQTSGRYSDVEPTSNRRARDQRSDATRASNQPDSQQAGASGAAERGAGSENAGTPWYRLAEGSTGELADYTNEPVRIEGTVTPGKDEQGADVVIHRIGPEQTTVTVLDLKPAPKLSVESITPIPGSCPMPEAGASTRGAGASQR